MSLNAELDRARDLDVSELADAIESIGFEYTRCGACYKGCEGDDNPEPHTATAFPDEVRALQEAGGDDSKDESGAPMEWRDVTRPVPYGLVEGDNGSEGETFEWTLQAIAYGDCRFYEGDDSGRGACQVHKDHPLICETYPFNVALGGTSQPMGEATDEEGTVYTHKYEGLGRDISRADTEELARALEERAVQELHEAQGVAGAYESVEARPGEVVIHDSEGAKQPDGTRVQ